MVVRRHLVLSMYQFLQFLFSRISVKLFTIRNNKNSILSNCENTASVKNSESGMKNHFFALL